jgi:hypothetical protein
LICAIAQSLFVFIIIKGFFMSGTPEITSGNTVTFHKHSYSGTDIRVFALVDPIAAASGSSVVNDIYKELAEVSTISFSAYREKEMVKSLGMSSAMGFTRGYRTIAGTIIFTVFYKAVLNEIVKRGVDSNDRDYRFVMIDQLPPIDIFITFQNEVGNLSKLMIFGCEFMNEGQVMSINDLVTENSVNFMARHVTALSSVDTPEPTLEDLQQSARVSGIKLMQKEIEAARQDMITLRERFL